MPTHIRFEFFGDAQVDRTLESLSARASDLRPAWDDIEDRFTAYEERWFNSEGDGSWPDLSKDYARWKAKHFPGRPILVREGDLKKSVTKPDIAIKEPAYAVFGTSDPVAEYHQHGRGRLPVRRVVDIDDDEKAEWIRVVQRFLIEDGDSR